jgi:serine/threonine-protein phosphatase 2B regulatory subunit
MNPLLPRITALFGIKGSAVSLFRSTLTCNAGDDHINFKQFVTVLSAVSPSAPKEERIKCIPFGMSIHFNCIPGAFKVYDINDDGFITQEELFNVLKLMVGKNLTDDQLQVIARSTLQRADKDKDGKISLDEFSRVRSSHT